MECNCTSTKLIPSCTDNLLIGYIDDLSTSVFIFLKNDTTGYIKRFTAVNSSALGLVTLDMTVDPNYFQPGQTFTLWVTLATTSQDEPLDIKIVGNEFQYFQLEFEKITDTTLVDYTNHTLQLDESFTRVEPIIWFDSTQKVITQTGNADVTRWTNLGSGPDAIESVVIGASLPALDALNVAVDFNREGLALADFSYTRTYMHYMCVFNSTDVASLKYMMSHYDTPTDIAWRVGVDGATGRFLCEIRGSVANGKVYTIDDIDVRSQYVLGEFVWDGSDLKLYVNNIPYNNSQTEDDAMTSILDSTSVLVVGGDLGGGGIQNEFTGKIKEMKIFDSALSATQRQEEVLELIAKL